MKLSESELVGACQRGDRAAQKRLFESTQARIFRVIARIVGEREAVDVTQQAYLQVFRKIGQFSGRSTLATWVYRIAVNEALQHIRRRGRRTVTTLEFEPVDHAPNQTNIADLRDALDAALADIDPELKAVFLLKEVDELSYSEIAHVLSIPEGTVGSRLNRARRELQDRLKACGWAS
ncbi:MAG: RNA polymerase subunit sigma-24 [Planctomycetaceae bacterium]|nr:RNA polymerase subunit sigma-24 [Planctomycetaceae bacterium]